MHGIHARQTVPEEASVAQPPSLYLAQVDVAEDEAGKHEEEVHAQVPFLHGPAHVAQSDA